MAKRKKKQTPPFHDIETMEGYTERTPLSPVKYELFANAIVRNGGDVRKASEDMLDPLEDPLYTSMESLPEPIVARVKYLLKRVASDTVATRREVEEILTFALRGDEDRGGGITRIDAARELCKMNGWYSPVEVKQTKEIIVPRQIAELSDNRLREIAMTTAYSQAETIDAEVIETDKEKANVETTND